METLTNGYKKPETGDKGNVFFPALEENIQRLNDHTHDGSNSEKLDSQSVKAVTQDLSSASWVASGTRYKQVVTMPGTLQFEEAIMSFKVLTGTYANFICFPGVKKLTNNTFEVYVADNSLDLRVYYV